MWFDEANRVHVLECFLACIVCFGGSCEYQQWPAVGSRMWDLETCHSGIVQTKLCCITYTRENMKHAWCTHAYAHSRLSR